MIVAMAKSKPKFRAGCLHDFSSSLHAHATTFTALESMHISCAVSKIPDAYITMKARTHM